MNNLDICFPCVDHCRQVDTDTLFYGRRMSQLESTVRLLSAILGHWLADQKIPEVDWNKVRSLEFQENLRARDELSKKLPEFTCTQCLDFEEHVSSIILGSWSSN